jgi:hypothetical protein
MMIATTIINCVLEDLTTISTAFSSYAQEQLNYIILLSTSLYENWCVSLINSINNFLNGSCLTEYRMNLHDNLFFKTYQRCLGKLIIRYTDLSYPDDQLNIARWFGVPTRPYEPANRLTLRYVMLLLFVTFCVVMIAVALYLLVRRYGKRGPFSSLGSSQTPFYQNLLIDKTKTNIKSNFHLLDSMTTEKPRRLGNNGHPISGAVRDAGRLLITNAVTAAGKDIYEISPWGNSKAEKKQVQHFAPADLSHDYRLVEDVNKDRDVIVMIDCDYYVEDIASILKFGAPICLFSFNPIAVAGMDGDSSFRITDDVITYNVSGGTSWKHQVWDWCGYGEYVKSSFKGFKQRFFRLFGLEKVVIYKIHHARPFTDCPHRVIIWILPQYTYWSFTFATNDINVRELKRVSYTDKNKPGFNTVTYQDGQNVQINFGRADCDSSYTMKKVDFDLFMGCNTATAITSRAKAMGYKDESILAALSQFFNAKEGIATETPRIAGPIKPKVYWPASATEDIPKITARAYGSSILSTPSLIPSLRHFETTSDAINYRVTDVKNTKRPSKNIEYLVKEFVDLLVPDPHVGHPYELEETVLLLDKPKQAAGIKLIWDTVDLDPKRMIECFVKNEPTSKSARIISSFPDFRFLLNFSKYTLKFRNEVLHNESNHHWFMPGHGPQEIAKVLQEYVGSIGTPIEGDFENFDGTVSEYIQSHVANAVLHRYFSEEHHDELKRYTGMLISCPARSKSFNFKYEAGFGIKSGSPTTCDLNTVINAFVNYCAIKLSYPELTPRDAYNNLGPCFGDDSVSDGATKNKLLEVAKNLGLRMKAIDYDPELGLCFLGRVFPNIYETLTSFQDVKRTLKKLHLTTRDPNVSLADATMDRVEGYMVTDKYTPIISDYCIKMIHLYAHRASSKVVREKRKCVAKEKPYWLVSGGWYQDIKDTELMTNCVAARLGITAAKVVELCDKIFEMVTPFDKITIEIEDYETGTKNCIHEDGSSDPVDERLVSQHRQINNERRMLQQQTANGNNARTTNSPTDQGHSENQAGCSSNNSRDNQRSSNGNRNGNGKPSMRREKGGGNGDRIDQTGHAGPGSSNRNSEEQVRNNNRIVPEQTNNQANASNQKRTRRGGRGNRGTGTQNSNTEVAGSK